MVETIKFDSQGRRIHPPVKIGNERLDRGGSSKLSNGFVACNEHGTARRVWVKFRGLLCACCRYCIVQNCELTQAVPRPNYSAEELESPNMDHPDGHSY
jgi:hypothetical protein